MVGEEGALGVEVDCEDLLLTLLANTVQCCSRPSWVGPPREYRSKV